MAIISAGYPCFKRYAYLFGTLQKSYAKPTGKKINNLYLFVYKINFLLSS